MNKPWIAFFSQTGSEICDLAESLGKWPDVIVTNIRPKHERTIDPRLEGKKLTLVPNKPNALHYKHILRAKKDPIVTLHGWLRIVPEKITNEYEIYNGHPGLITKYPELKGKDPQVRTWEGIKKDIYPTAGCVIHRVTAGVDEGKVLSFERFATWDIATLDELFDTLRDRSLYLWVNLLTGIVVDKK